MKFKLIIACLMLLLGFSACKKEKAEEKPGFPVAWTMQVQLADGGDILDFVMEALPDGSFRMTEEDNTVIATGTWNIVEGDFTANFVYQGSNVTSIYTAWYVDGEPGVLVDGEFVDSNNTSGYWYAEASTMVI